MFGSGASVAENWAGLFRSTAEEEAPAPAERGAAASAKKSPATPRRNPAAANMKRSRAGSAACCIMPFQLRQRL